MVLLCTSPRNASSILAGATSAGGGVTIAGSATAGAGVAAGVAANARPVMQANAAAAASFRNSIIPPLFVPVFRRLRLGTVPVRDRDDAKAGIQRRHGDPDLAGLLQREPEGLLVLEP